MMDNNKLKEILENHKKWLMDEGGQMANLKMANLRWADLRGANLRGADLEMADLGRANLIGADLEMADLRGANFEMASLKEANFRGADLEMADLRGANLKMANLIGADLRGVDFRGADLDFSTINLSCKDLGIHLDDKLAIQRLYHLLYNVSFSKNITQDIKDLLLTDELLELANKFHRVDECGTIEKSEVEDDG